MRKERRPVTALEQMQIEVFKVQIEYYTLLAKEIRNTRKKEFNERKEKLRRLSPVQRAIYAKTGKIAKIYSANDPALLRKEIARLQEELKSLSI